MIINSCFAVWPSFVAALSILYVKQTSRIFSCYSTYKLQYMVSSGFIMFLGNRADSEDKQGLSNSVNLVNVV